MTESTKNAAVNIAKNDIVLESFQHYQSQSCKELVYIRTLQKCKLHLKRNLFTFQSNCLKSLVYLVLLFVYHCHIKRKVCMCVYSVKLVTINQKGEFSVDFP